MRRIIKITTAIGGVLLAVMIARLMFSGEYALFFLVPGSRFVADGKPVSGWLHRGTKGRMLIVTVSRSAGSETYWIALQEEKPGGVARCDAWGSSRFPILVFGDVVPSCLFDAGGEQEDGLPHPSQRVNRDLATGKKWIEFTADSGSRVHASW
jgi:hypothetical protein